MYLKEKRIEAITIIKIHSKKKLGILKSIQSILSSGKNWKSLKDSFRS